MIIVNYKSKRKLKKQIGNELKCAIDGHKGSLSWTIDGPVFVTNDPGTFQATVTMVNGIIESVR